MKRLTPRPSLVFSTTSGPLRVIRQGWVRSGARRKRDNGATGGTVPAQHSEEWVCANGCHQMCYQ